jgi:DNA-binding IclR family transcriptional regulator
MAAIHGARMPKSDDERTGGEGQAGARAILRVPEVLIEIASSRSGHSLADLSARLSIPKASLHRLVRTLESGGYLVHDGGVYRLGPARFHLGSLIAPIQLGRSLVEAARPELERLADATGETIMLGSLSEDRTEIVYVDVIDSRQPVRFTISIGDRRALYSVASGKAALAFFSPGALGAYLDGTAFTRFTPSTTSKAELPGLLPQVRAQACAFDDGGRAPGASALASPVFNSEGHLDGAISVAGPTDRIIANRPRIEPLVRKAGERISRALGYDGAYPPEI